MTAVTSTREERVDRPRVVTVTRIGYVVLIGALVVPRLHSGSPLWLDEALSVNIARLPLPELFSALRQDGSPPFYYLLLHLWVGVFGTGAVAVRALSTLFSLAALPVAYGVGRRLAPARGGPWAMLLVAACPFAIRYATETRMYALVMLLGLVAVLAALRALDDPTAPRLVSLALVTGLLALTHYWTLFFLVVGEVVLLVHAWRAQRRGPAVRVAVAAPCGALLFVPWVPSFLFQSAHTGTPWADPPTWHDASNTLQQWFAPPGSHLGTALLAGVAVLVVAGLLGPARSTVTTLLLLGLGALVLGLAASRWQGSGYSLRYSAAAIVPVLLAAAVGAPRLPRRVEVAVGAVVGALALSVVATTSLLDTRTQAGDTAALLETRLRAGDLVVYCPDQLGPAVDRLLPAGTDEVVYPTMGPPQRVDWVDYEARNAAASPSAFAAAVDARTTGAVWLVGNDSYRTFGDQCAQLDRDLTALRGGHTVLQEESSDYEKEWLVGYPAPASTDRGQG